jgi:uncharacterized protein with HEPN domain
VSSRDWKVRIEDMLDALDRIHRYTHGMDRDEFCEDERTVDAVSRNLEIIGEAARKVPTDVTHRHHRVPWSKMAEMRNILIHEYHAVAPEIVWATVLNDLPPLSAMLRDVLKKEG